MATKVCIFNPTTKLIDIKDGVSVFTGDPATVGLPVVLNSAGTIDPSLLNSNPLLATASEALSAGSLVNLYPAISGSLPIAAQLADAAHITSPPSSGLPAMGFVSSSYNIGDVAVIFTQGLVTVPFTTGFSPNDIGKPIYLSTTVPGGVTKTIPVSPDLIQPLGYIYLVSGTLNGYLQFQFVPSQSVVVSVGLVVPSRQSVSGSPVTNTGTLIVSDNTQAANLFFAGPVSGSAATPTFRSLVTADFPASGVTAGSYTFSNITIDATGRVTAASTGAPVTSVSLSAPSEIVVTGSPVTTTGTLALAWHTQQANYVFAGPASSITSPPTSPPVLGTPSFRPLVAADLPVGTGTVTSVGLTMPLEFNVANSPITGSNTFTVTKAAQLPNLVYASPNVSSPPTGVPVFRSLVPADLPIATTGAVGAVSVDGTTITVTGGGQISVGVVPLSSGGTNANLSLTGGAHQVLRQSTVGGTISVSQLGFSDLSGTSSVMLSSRTLVNVSSYPVVTTDRHVGVTYTATGAATVTLYDAATVTAGTEVIIKDEAGNASVHNIIIATTSSQTIDGNPPNPISSNYGVLRVYSDGANWQTF